MPVSWIDRMKWTNFLKDTNYKCILNEKINSHISIKEIEYVIKNLQRENISPH